MTFCLEQVCLGGNLRVSIQNLREKWRSRFGASAIRRLHSSSCDALKTSIDRRPIPLATASSTFNRRVSSASSHLNLLESISSEELRGPQGQPLPPQQDGLHAPEDDDDDDDDDLLDESLSLKKLGLSYASLATLAFQANARNEDQHVSFPSSLSYDPSKESSGASADGSLSDCDVGEVEDKQMVALAPLHLVKVCRDDYESLPSRMKSLAPWEDLLAAVEKINSGLKQ